MALGFGPVVIPFFFWNNIYLFAFFLKIEVT